MDQLGRAGPTLPNRRRRPIPGGSGMAAIGTLVRNPVAITVVDGEGPHAISAERGPAGKVWLTCQCAASAAEGWCQHRVDLLCFRYDGAPSLDETTRRAFEEIVTGSALFDAGRDADRALTAFDQCLRTFDERRPAKVVGRSLGKFTELVSDLAACSGELEDALGTLRRLLERA